MLNKERNEKLPIYLPIESARCLHMSWNLFDPHFIGYEKIFGKRRCCLLALEEFATMYMPREI